MQSLRQQNLKLKTKMTQLTMALDKAIGTRNANVHVSSPDRRLIRKPPFSGNQEGGNYSSNRRTDDGQQDQELRKQMDINRRLNDLLNQKDEEILSLNNQILELKLNKTELNRSKSNLSQETKSPKPVQLKSPIRGNFKQGDEVSVLEHKLRESERLNKEY